MRVYHLTCKGYALSDLEHQRIKVARFGNLNDPFELLGVELSKRNVRERFRQWKREANAKYGLICFSATWQNPVLWSHYADRHQGLCLGFDVPNNKLRAVKYVEWRSPSTDIIPGNDQLKSLLYTKFRDWEYEEEYRQIINLADAREKKGLHFWPFGPDLALREVITGARCKITDKFLKDTFGDKLKRVKLTRARLAFRRFQIVTNRQGWNPPKPRDEVR